MNNELKANYVLFIKYRILIRQQVLKQKKRGLKLVGRKS